MMVLRKISERGGLPSINTCMMEWEVGLQDHAPARFRSDPPPLDRVDRAAAPTIPPQVCIGKDLGRAAVLELFLEPILEPFLKLGLGGNEAEINIVILMVCLECAKNYEDCHILLWIEIFI